MFQKSTRSTVFAAAAIGITVILAATVFGLRPGEAEGQGITSVPACQCSAATVVSEISTSLVHCVCGGMACVVSQHAGPNAASNEMHCAR